MPRSSLTYTTHSGVAAFRHDRLPETIVARRLAEAVNSGQLSLLHLKFLIEDTYREEIWDPFAGVMYVPTVNNYDLIGLVVGMVTSRPALEYIADEIVEFSGYYSGFCCYVSHLEDITDKEYVAQRVFESLRKQVGGMRPKGSEREYPYLRMGRWTVDKLCDYILKLHKPTGREAIKLSLPYSDDTKGLLRKLREQFGEAAYLEGERKFKEGIAQNSQ